MQIIPTHSKQSFVDQFMGINTYDQDDTTFLEEMLRQQQARASVNAASSFSVSSALAENTSTPPNISLATAPYSKHSSDGVTYSLDEVCFTKPELTDLRQQLLQEGAPPETLLALAVLIQQPDGATLAQVTTALRPEFKPVHLSEAEKISLKSFAERVDPSGKLGDALISLAQEGKGKEIWGQITTALNALNTLHPGTTFTADRAELAVLGKAMGLSPNAQQQIVGNFGPFVGAVVTQKGFEQIMIPAQHDLMLREQNQQKLDKALDVALKPILTKAKARMQAEKEASEHTNRRAEQSKVLIEKTVLRNVEATVDKTQKATVDQTQKPTQGDASPHNHQGTHKNTATPNTTVHTAAQPTHKNVSHETIVPNPAPAPAPYSTEAILQEMQVVAHKTTAILQDAPSQSSTQATQPSAHNKAVEHSLGQQNQQQGQDARGGPGHMGQHTGQNTHQGRENPADATRSGWDSLISKVDVQQGSGINSARSGWDGLISKVDVLQGAGINTIITPFSASAPSAVENMPAAKASLSLAPRQALSQVENALLTAMRDGTKRLEIQLNPGELGTLTLTLTSRNGEVSALIRSEKGETAEMLTRQLDVLRTNLEQQGIKVDKLEVQNQAQERANQQWDGAQQHNAKQEEYARRDTLERLRNLARMRNDDSNDSNALLEQDMQSTGHTAGSATQGIYYVA